MTCVQKENEQLMKSIDPNAVVSMSTEKSEGLEAALKEKEMLRKKLEKQKQVQLLFFESKIYALAHAHTHIATLQEAQDEKDALIAQQSKLKVLCLLIARIRALVLSLIPNPP